MTTKRLSRDDELARNMEGTLASLLLDGELPYITDAEGMPLEADIIETYEEQGLFTKDRGLVVKLSDGRELHLTITAYGPAR